MSMRHLAELHAVIVHFPIALLLISVALDFAAVIFRRVTLLDGASWTLLFGAPLAVVAIITGWLTEHHVQIATAAGSAMVRQHKIAAALTAAVFGMLFLARLTWLLSRMVGWLRLAFPHAQALARTQSWLGRTLPQAYVKPLPRWMGVAYLLLSVLGVILLGATTYYGESLVYVYGIGLPLP